MALFWKKDKETWIPTTWKQADSQVRALAKGLRSLGVSTGDRVVLVSENSPEWGISDLAIMAAGAGVFSRIFIHETMGVSLGMGEEMTPENIKANWDKISDMTNARALQNGGEQTLKFFELINK